VLSRVRTPRNSPENGSIDDQSAVFGEAPRCLGAGEESGPGGRGGRLPESPALAAHIRLRTLRREQEGRGFPGMGTRPFRVHHLLQFHTLFRLHLPPPKSARKACVLPLSRQDHAVHSGSAQPRPPRAILMHCLIMRTGGRTCGEPREDESILARARPAFSLTRGFCPLFPPCALNLRVVLSLQIDVFRTG